MQRKRLLLSLGFLVIAGLLFFRPQPAVGQSCSGQCQWYICAYIAQGGGQSNPCSYMGLDWYDVGIYTSQCQPNSGTCECNGPQCQINENFAFIGADCPINWSN